MQGYTYFFPIAYSATDVAIYQQDVVIHRSEGTSYEETVGDFKVWHVYVGDRCKSDYGDVRFTDASGTALAYYLWPDYDSSGARFCVRLEGATSAGSLCVWYGNPTATTTSDGASTYHLFDHFDGAEVDLEKWITAEITSPTISDSVVSFSSLGGRSLLKTVDKTPTNVIVECRLRSTGTSPGCGIVLRKPSLTPGAGGYLLFTGSGPDEIYIGINKYTGDSPPTNLVRKSSSYDGGWRTFVFRTVGNEISGEVYQDDGTQDFSASVTDSSYPSAGYLGIIAMWSDKITHCDYILTRAYSATPPSAIAFGPEQVPGTLHHVVFGSANMMVI